MYTCPVCGYPELEEPPYVGQPEDGLPSYDFCPSCSFQYGVSDYDTKISFEQWRQKWIKDGMVWDEGDSEPPEGWNPKKQLLNIGVKI